MKIMESEAKQVAALRYPLQYAAKFICTSNIPGTSQTTLSFLPGSYATCVNIHNPGKPIRGRMKLAMPGQISKWVAFSLKYDEASRVTCDDLNEKFGLHLIHGFEGFLVIESTGSLDVIAVYTAGPGGRGEPVSIDVQDVRERKL